MPTSVLSDGTIRRLVAEGAVRIDPWDPDMVQPASVDLRLGGSFRVFHNFRVPAIDLADPPTNLTEHIEVPEGDQFVIHPGEFCLGATQEWVELPDDIVARIEGKALALDTEIPTSGGWKTMRELRTGDWLFDETGEMVEVVRATRAQHGRPCRRVVFSDGTAIVADVEHEWEVDSKGHGPGRTRQVLTTGQIEESLRYSATEYRHHVAQSQAVWYPRQELPVDPYVLGAWIGDGTSSTAVITCADAEILEEISVAGYGLSIASGPIAYRIGRTGQRRDPQTGQFGADKAFQSVLRREGLLNNKHIPDAYMTASVPQRRALLAGLMDTDGYVDKWGRCELTTVRWPLAVQYRELIASLGFRPVIATKTATINGRDCGLKYDVTFTPDEPAFRLPRKVERQKREGRFKKGRTIVDVQPVESVPVRCIEVDSPRGLFLATRSFIPTHNSSLGRLGLIVHATAGFVDPGWKGTLTLEITNLTRVPIILWPGKPIAQLSFMTLDKPAERPYGHPELGSHYAGQRAATESRYEGGPAASRRPPVD